MIEAQGVSEMTKVNQRGEYVTVLQLGVKGRSRVLESAALIGLSTNLIGMDGKKGEILATALTQSVASKHDPGEDSVEATLKLVGGAELRKLVGKRLHLEAAQKELGEK